MSTTLPINFSSVINCIDDRGLFFLQIGINRRYLRLLKSDTAAVGVIGIAMKSCIQRHSIHLDKMPLRPPKLLQTKMVIFSFAGLRIRMYRVPLDATFHCNSNDTIAAVYGFGGRKYHRFIPFNFLLSLAAPHLHGILVLVTGNKYSSSISWYTFKKLAAHNSSAWLA
jgi:hypothetical protein